MRRTTYRVRLGACCIVLRAYSQCSLVAAMMVHPFPDQPVEYHPPSWTSGTLRNVPQHGRLHLANLPTPLYCIDVTASTWTSWLRLPSDCSFYVKRDDSSSGIEMGGNKIRKLEFLLADAIKSDCDCVVTIGDEQSNHCRATASASRVVGMEPHLILRSSKDAADLGLVGNVLFDRVVGSQIYTCTPGEYGRIGSDELVSRLCQHLRKVDKKPYAIPVGGSNGLGSWGYINGVYELIAQWQTLLNDMSPGSTAKSLDHIVFACGSGGTAAGISLGIALATASYTNVFGTKPMVHAIGVCDDEEYFYRFVSKIADQMGFLLPQSGKFESTEAFIRHHLKVHQGKGLGYARSTPEELDFVVQFARRTGIVLDPVYTGKALKNFFNFVEEHPNDFLGKTILFWHTGGGLGLFGKSSDLHATLQTDSPCQRLDVYGKGMGIDVSSPINH